MPETPEFFRTPGVQLQNIVGGDIASAATIAPTCLIHTITGSAAIVNITIPYQGFAGMLVLVAAGIFTWTAAGNIGTAGTSTAVGRAMIFFYNPITSKWVPAVFA